MEITRAEAMAEARSHFGPQAILQQELTWGLEDGAMSVVCRVGVRSQDSFNWTVYGEGPTWRAAIGDGRGHSASTPTRRQTKGEDRPRAVLP